MSQMDKVRTRCPPLPDLVGIAGLRANFTNQIGLV